MLPLTERYLKVSGTNLFNKIVNADGPYSELFQYMIEHNSPEQIDECIERLLEYLDKNGVADQIHNKDFFNDNQITKGGMVGGMKISIIVAGSMVVIQSLMGIPVSFTAGVCYAIATSIAIAPDSWPLYDIHTYNYGENGRGAWDDESTPQQALVRTDDNMLRIVLTAIFSVLGLVSSKSAISAITQKQIKDDLSVAAAWSCRKAHVSDTDLADPIQRPFPTFYDKQNRKITNLKSIIHINLKINPVYFVLSTDIKKTKHILTVDGILCFNKLEYFIDKGGKLTRKAKRKRRKTKTR